MLSKEDKCTYFDYQFYLKTYTDLIKAGISTEEAAFIHYTQFGLAEGRTGSLYEMQYTMKKNTVKVKEQYNSFKPNLSTAPENKITILVRTSDRPNHFAKCIQSIFEQSYQNFHIFVCYDKISSLDYLECYEKNTQITYFPVYVKSDEKYKFNLYCNKLLDKVNDGHILFLDDDDMLVHNHVLAILNDEIGQCKDSSTPENLIVGQFMRADKLIYPKDITSDMVLGEITASSVCFHHSFKHNIKWDDKQCGDFRFFSQVLNHLPRSIIKQTNYIIASTQFDNKIGHYGESE
jgi:hypothetical protein